MSQEGQTESGNTSKISLFNKLNRAYEQLKIDLDKSKKGELTTEQINDILSKVTDNMYEALDYIRNCTCKN